MPTYEYRCAACGHEFEKFQSITSAPIKQCPQCNKKKVKRLIGTGAGVIFKGSGFYITDYRSDSYKSAAKSDSGGKSDASKPAETKSDANPAAKESTSSSTSTTSSTPAATVSKPSSKPSK